MKIEMYLRDVLQDFPDSKYSSSDDNNVCKNWNDSAPWYNPWTNQPWYQTNAPNLKMVSVLDQRTERINLVRMRQENFGGVFFDPITAAVYKVDKEGYKFVELLKKGEKPGGIGKKLKLSKRKCSDFLESLINFGLW